MSPPKGLQRKEWKWQQRSLHQIPRWWHYIPLSSLWSSLLQLSSWHTGHLHHCTAPVRVWETNGKYRHFHWLPVNPTSPQLSWSTPDDPGPALLPCQADSSVSSNPPLGACSCGTDRKWNIRLSDIGSQALQTQNPVTYKEVKTLLHSQFKGDWKKDNGGYQGITRPNLETGVGPTDHHFPPIHGTLWSERSSEEDWHFRLFPVWVRTNWPNPRPLPSVLPKICQETSANMGAWSWSGDQDMGLGRGPLPDRWFCGINWTENLTCTAVAV